MHIPPNWGTFFALIVSFVIFWFIFSRLFFRPFLNLLSERERRLKDLGDRTGQLLKEARAADEEREQRLAQVRREAISKRDSERQRADAEATEIVERAKLEAQQLLERARVAVEDELKAAEGELERAGRSLAAELAERVLGRRLNASRGSS